MWREPEVMLDIWGPLWNDQCSVSRKQKDGSRGEIQYYDSDIGGHRGW